MRTNDRDSAVNTVRLIQAVEVTSIFGVGTMDDPFHTVTEWFLPDGTRIGRSDGGQRAANAIYTAMKHPDDWKPGARIKVEE